MLVKLIKRNIIRDYIPMLIFTGIIVFAAIAVKIYEIIFFSNATVSPLANIEDVVRITFYMVSVIAVVLSFVIYIDSFNKSMLKDEGFLTHTLPVKASTLMLSELLTAYIWIILIAGVYFICDFLLFGKTSMLNSFDILKFFDGFKIYFNQPSDNDTVTFLGLCLIFTPFIFISLAYFILSLNNLILKNKWLIIITYLIILFVSIFISFNLLERIFDTDNPAYFDLYPDEIFMIMGRATINYLVWIPVLFSAFLYYLSTVIFNKKLNL